MPYLYCERHGQEHEADIVGRQDELRQEGEIVLVVSGRLNRGTWECDRCSAPLRPGDRSTLITAFSSHCLGELYDYNFAYEREYFAMSQSDRAAVYGADWPDDSIKTRRDVSRREAGPRRRPPCALDFPPPDDAGGSR
jgi:hypothetical protein